MKPRGLFGRDDLDDAKTMPDYDNLSRYLAETAADMAAGREFTGGQVAGMALASIAVSLRAVADHLGNISGAEGAATDEMASALRAIALNTE